MLVADGKITMSDAEWLKFQELTWAPWTPRTHDEFNAMCELARARHMADNTAGTGFIFALAVDSMKFGPNGEVNFPEDKRRLAYVEVHGTWPSDAELEAFEAGTSTLRTGLTLVRDA